MINHFKRDELFDFIYWSVYNSGLSDHCIKSCIELLDSLNN